jgi:small subunit ribosomal protein S17
MVRILTGVVTSTKMAKTAVVSIERKFRHPRYRKVITKHKKFQAHNEKFDLKDGDYVRIQETKPLSKNKHFEVIEKLKEKTV